MLGEKRLARSVYEGMCSHLTGRKAVQVMGTTGGKEGMRRWETGKESQKIAWNRFSDAASDF